MAKIRYKYIWREHTMVQINKSLPKVRVNSNEIIESEMPFSYMILNRFVAVDDKGEKLDPKTITGSKEFNEKKEVPVNPEAIKKEKKVKKLENSWVETTKVIDDNIDNTKEVVEDKEEENDMTIEEARAYLKKNNVKFHHAIGLKKLLVLVAEHKSK